MRDEPFSFRPLRVDDFPLLHDWLQRPHVAKWWWDASDSFDDTCRDFLPLTDERSPTRGYIACLAGEPIGFIQSYVVFGCGGGWWEEETDPGARGIDQFLCDEASLGRGLGARMIAAFVDRLFDDDTVTKVQIDPSPDNPRAIRCYRKVGFREVGVVGTPDGPALLMIVTRDQRAHSAVQVLRA